MNRPYLFKVLLYYLILGVLIALNHFFGGAISGEFQFFANVALLLIAAISIFVLLFRQLKDSHAKDRNATAAARAEVLKEIEKKLMNGR
jgi:hypothetical protein